MAHTLIASTFVPASSFGDDPEGSGVRAMRVGLGVATGGDDFASFGIEGECGASIADLQITAGKQKVPIEQGPRYNGN